MRESFVEPDGHRNPVRMGDRQTPPQILVLRLARPQYDKRRLEPREDQGERGNQIEPLLGHHPRDHADERTSERQVVRRQTESCEHGRLGRALPRQVRGAVCTGQERVAFRVPAVGVDPVQNAHEVGGPAAEDPIEAEARFWRLNLSRVGRTDRRHQFGVVDAALQETDPAPVLHPFWRKQAPR